MAATDNLGPMPTPAALPSRCRVPVISGACTSADCTGSLALACAGTTATPDPGCWPVGTATASSDEAGLLGYGGRGYYSPAVACPVDYTTAGGVVTLVDEDDADEANGGDVTVYKVHCCPSGYSRVQSEVGDRLCQTEVSATTYSATLCGGDTDDDDDSGDEGDDAAVGTTISLPLTATDDFWGDTWTVTAQTLQAPAIEIRFRSTDLARATATTAAPAAADQDAESPSSALPGRLPRNAEIGLGVGIPIAGIAVAGLAWVWYKRRGWRSK